MKLIVAMKTTELHPSHVYLHKVKKENKKLERLTTLINNAEINNHYFNLLPSNLIGSYLHEIFKNS
jgi:predicted transcriptional regulator